MATFIKRKNKWLVQIRRKGYDSISKTFDSREEAEDFAYNIEEAIKNDEYGKPSPVALPISSKDLKRMYDRMIRRSNKKQWSDSISFSEFCDLYSRTGGKCSVSGIYFSSLKINESRSRPYYPSIDRIDSSKGYTKDNIRFVCCAVNVALSDFGDDVLKQIAFGVVKQAVLNHEVMRGGNIQKKGGFLVLPDQKEGL